MILPQNLKDECQAELERCHAIAVARHPDANIPLPRITYNQRGLCAGQYIHSQRVIKINPILLIENVREMVDNTVSHEFAHCADISVHGVQFKGRTKRGLPKRVVHGPTFKAFQRSFGRCDATFHTMDTSNARVREKKSTKVHVWVCGCGKGEVKLTPKKHSRQLNVAPNGHGVYRRGHTAKRCGNYTYVGKEGATTVAQPIAASAPKPVPASQGTQSPRATSWKQTSLQVYQQVSGARADFIRTMVSQGMKKVTASTYHHNIKSGKWT